MRRALLLLVAGLVAAAALAGTSSAAKRMFVGFQDDRSFQLLPNRAALLDRAEDAHARIVRSFALWYELAPTRPARAADPADPAYQFGRLDELVRNARERGMDVMLTIWGTPGWAGGGPNHNRAPKSKDIRAFAHALAKRYSGSFQGLPRVRFYTVWNEANTGRFLFPQYAPGSTRPVSPRLYATLYRAAYKGIKSGNRRAKVAIGLTSPRGRPRVNHKEKDQLYPLDFARGVARACAGRCRFQAYAHNPYPTTPRANATQRVKAPSINLRNLSTLERTVKQAFRLKRMPRIWITEMGFRTNPPNPQGMSRAKQAANLRTSLLMAKRDPRVDMYIWFIFQDDAGAPKPTTWESAGGVLDGAGRAKPSYRAFAKLAKPIRKPY
ncbi:MAG: DUF5722 domain-containing protein [Thermoleophilia bacterium]